MLLNRCPRHGFHLPLFSLIVTIAIAGSVATSAQQLPAAPTAAPDTSEPAGSQPKDQQHPSFKPQAPDTSGDHRSDAMGGMNGMGSGNSFGGGGGGMSENHGPGGRGDAPSTSVALHLSF